MEELKEQCHGGWDVKLQDLFTKADEDMVVPRTMYVFTIGFSWSWCKGVTVTDPSMTSFAGEGADDTGCHVARTATRGHVKELFG